MTKFRVSTYFQGLPLPQRLMARFELASWLSGRGETTLAKAVCNAATPEGLDPHLKKADSLLKDSQPKDIFRSSRLFTADGKLIETSPSKGPDINSMSEQLSAIAEQIRSRLPANEKIQGTKLVERMDKALANKETDDDYRALIEGLILEGQGYLVGASGGELDTEIPKEIIVSPTIQDDPWIYSAQLFIDAMRSGHIEARGRQKTDQRWLANAFISGALDVWDLGITKNKVPAFVEKAARYWARAQGMPYSALVENYTRRLGAGFGRFMLQQIRLGLVSGLFRSKLMSSLHLINADVFIYGCGWLAGHFDAVQRDSDHGTVIALNLLSITNCALKKRDAGYMAVAALAIPEILKLIEDAAKCYEGKGQQSAADTIRNNQGNIIHRALANGQLINYAKEALDAVPGMLKEIEDAAKRFESKGDQAAADSIRANQGTITCRALNRGTLINHAKNALDAVPKILKKIDDTVKHFESKGQQVAADSILTNQESIINHALSRSSEPMNYVKDALDAVPGIIKEIDDTAKHFESEGHQIAADSILANQGTIIYHALHHGRLMSYVKNALEAVPTMLKEIDDAADQVESKGQQEVADSIRANQGIIIYRALNQGSLMNYVRCVLDAVPAMLKEIDDAAARLAIEGQKETAESIRVNKGSIMTSAIHRGRLMNYVKDALDAVPVMLKEIEDAVKHFESEGQQAAADVIQANQGTIIYRALNQGSLMNYVKDALDAVPVMLKEIDDAITLSKKSDNTSAAAWIEANRKGIIYRGLSYGGLVNSVRAELDAFRMNE
jgi:hypothetical protein